ACSRMPAGHVQLPVEPPDLGEVPDAAGELHGVAVGLAFGGLELGGERQEGGLVVLPSQELRADRQAGGAEPGGHAGGGPAEDVPGPAERARRRRELAGRPPAAAAERADAQRELGGGRGQDDVGALEDLPDPAAHAGFGAAAGGYEPPSDV